MNFTARRHLRMNDLLKMYYIIKHLSYTYAQLQEDYCKILTKVSMTLSSIEYPDKFQFPNVLKSLSIVFLQRVLNCFSIPAVLLDIIFAFGPRV
ncbi:hypothetical protein RCL_jg13243.t1 [Rhizophagus clarus]|uniref:Uncharacterized protein n=1 Tax=Rhizophagus clarus TaxID=94130 RepID=A0A8H3QFL6_9GLOM|nr:hypothetical protein RCL_jg13243.t1 [Rhizophagus clarus]